MIGSAFGYLFIGTWSSITGNGLHSAINEFAKKLSNKKNEHQVANGDRLLLA